MSLTKLLMQYGLTAEQAWGAQMLANAAKRFTRQYRYAEARALRRGDGIEYMVRWAKRKMPRG